MEIEEIVQAIGSVGFPIVACIAIFILYDKTIKEIINALTNVILTLNNVNDTLNKLDDKIDKIGN